MYRVACAATAQPGLGFGNLIGINRISVAVSYADNAGSGRGLGINGNRKIGRKGVVLLLLSLAVTVSVCAPSRQWRGRGVGVAPDAGITLDDNNAARYSVWCVRNLVHLCTPVGVSSLRAPDARRHRKYPAHHL